MTSTSTQVTIRVPTRLVEYADEQVAEGRAKSRSAFIADAMDHERQRLEDEREVAEFLRNRGPDPEMDALAEATGQRLGELWSHLD